MSFWGKSKARSASPASPGPKAKAKASATVEAEGRRSSRPGGRARPVPRPEAKEAVSEEADVLDKGGKAAAGSPKDLEKVKADVSRMFSILDINSNGTIERSELCSVLRRLEPRTWTSRSIDMLMSVIDTTKDGKIQFEELLDWVFHSSGPSDASASPEEVRFHQALGALLSSDHTSKAATGHEGCKSEKSKEVEADKLTSIPWQRMVSQTQGPFSLLSCRGAYRFNLDSGQLSLDSEPGTVVGTFSCDPIYQMSKFPRHQGGKQEIPCIRICKSEIIKEIHNPANANAYFVLPSQLNGAEYPSHKSIVTDIYGYVFDHTGGPRGQLAVHPAAGQFVLDNAANDSRPGGINAIDEICRRTADCGFALVNGYLQVPRFQKEEEKQMQEACKNFRKVLPTLRPIVMRGIPAQGLDKDLEDVCSTVKHRVSLIYASAIPVDSYLNKLGGGLDKDTRELNIRFQTHIAELVLLAQYYGALKTAALERRAKVFLMPLGGGVFSNPPEIIAASMSRAVEMLTKDELARLDIRILTWERSDEDQTFGDLMNAHRKLK